MALRSWDEEFSAGDVTRRREIVQQLLRAGEEASRAAIVLLQAVGDSDETVSTTAAAALEDLGPPRDIEPLQIAKFLSSAAPDCAYFAATLLGRMGPDAAPAVGLLTAALVSNPEPAVRERSAWALGKIGRAAESSRAALEVAGRSDSPRLSRLAQEALQQIGST
jgi:HEAT repeat protein